MIELPSGQLINLNDVIFVGNIKEVNNHYEFNVVWATKACEKLIYVNEKSCEIDREYIKKQINCSLYKDAEQDTTMIMICD